MQCLLPAAAVLLNIKWGWVNSLGCPLGTGFETFWEDNMRILLSTFAAAFVVATLAASMPANAAMMHMMKHHKKTHHKMMHKKMMHKM